MSFGDGAVGARAGDFELGTAFGKASSAVTKLQYRATSWDDIWIDDASAPDYNRWTKLCDSQANLDDLLSMFESRGWTVIDAAQAFADPVFDKAVDTMPAGQGMLWAHAKAAGRDVRYPAEDRDYEKSAMDRLGL